MIVTLTPNPALDVTYGVASLRPGESHRIEDISERAGGKGINTAAVLTMMGHECVAIAPVGHASMASFGDDLTARGVPHRLIETPGSTRRSTAVVDSSGEATLFNEAGQALPERMWDSIAAAITRAAPAARVLTISGSLPSGAPIGVIQRLTDVAHEAGLQVILDASGAQLARALTSRPEIVKPNRSEAAATFGSSPHEPPSAAELALALHVAGARAAIVTDGVRGLTLVTDGVRLRAWLPKPLRGNATGAGDALTASLAASLNANVTTTAAVPTTGGDNPPQHNWPEILRAAVAWSAAAVLQPLAGSVDPSNVDALMPEVEIEELP
jgi:tagatose 6-phosphate kinase